MDSFFYYKFESIHPELDQIFVKSAGDERCIFSSCSKGPMKYFVYVPYTEKKYDYIIKNDWVYFRYKSCKNNAEVPRVNENGEMICRSGVIVKESSANSLVYGIDEDGGITFFNIYDESPFQDFKIYLWIIFFVLVLIGLLI
ncbi:hypothetical protein COU57_02580 [Candidatus Pacearchaeota archaeon CG10_big_fil_rev_8_21_14_0_10_32_14]|nr:MAG: hypothetical protein COU57_02580 [Candidatus Pacearchaeota archaeon CG10_big_fil_rev_8_21_14_0_10_32_14]